jgi:integrase
MARRRGTQKGHVHKQGKMWYVAYREDALDESGKIVRVRRNPPIGETKGVSKREAQRIADEEILNRVNSVSQRPGSMLTVRQFVDGRFKADVVKTKKHAGQLHYGYILDNHVLPALGDKRLRDVTHDDVQALINLKRDSGLSSQTVIHIRNVTNRVFKYAKTKKAFYGELPTEDIEMAEKVTKDAHAMDFDSAVGLLDNLQGVSLVAYAIVLLALTTSMNIAELLGLRRKRVNLSKNAIMLGDRLVDGESIAVRENYYRGVFGTVKQKSRNRDLPIPQVVLPVLRQLIDESRFKEPEGLVFATEKGTPLDEKNLMRRVIKPIAAKLKMPWMGWHVFRHTHCTLAEQLGMALSDRQAQMGHGDQRMTMHYTHLDLNRRRQTLDLMGEMLTAKNPSEVSTSANLALNDTSERNMIPVNCWF